MFCQSACADVQCLCVAPLVFYHTPKDGVMTCFQITVSAKHPLDLLALEHAAQDLGITKIVVYWVVPRDNFREFNRQQTSGHTLEFEQRVLSLNAPRNPFTKTEMQERLRKAELSKLTTEDQQLLNKESDDLKLRYLVMKSFEQARCPEHDQCSVKTGEKKEKPGSCTSARSTSLG